MKKPDAIYQSVAVICLACIIFSIWKQLDFLVYISILLALLSLLSNKIARLIHDKWMKLAEILTKIFPPILLGLVFYLFLTPIAFFSRLFNKKDALMLKSTSDSTFHERNKLFVPADFEKPW